jgi:hypothetical protein
MVSIVKPIRTKGPRRGAPCQGREQSGPTGQWPCLCGADYEVVKVAAYLESTGLLESAGLHRLEAGCSDQPLDFLASTVLVGHVEEDRRLR